MLLSLNPPSALLESLAQSLPKDRIVYIFIDDIGDHLENIEPEQIRKDINIIKEVLLQVETYNTSISDYGCTLRFISLLRGDLFDLMEGSNINKLREGSLELEWDEKSFAGLLIRRLSFFDSDLEKNLENPIDAIKKQFPDEIFTNAIHELNTKRFRTNFYAYVVAISFNRPRDFLKFCYAMRNRLSLKRVATLENIESAEMEYSDYFKNELRDELFLAMQILNCNLTQERMDALIDILDKDQGFSFAEIRTELGKYLGLKTSIGKKKIEIFMQELYRYGILGLKRREDKEINFKYLSNISLILEKIKDCVFFLHRGLWWFAHKRKNDSTRKHKGLKSHKDEVKNQELIATKVERSS